MGVGLAGRVEVTLITVMNVLIVCFKVGFLGNVGLFSAGGACCVAFSSVRKVNTSAPVCTSNCGMNAISRLSFSCSKGNPVGIGISVGGSLEVPTNDATRVSGSVVNGLRIDLLLTGGPHRHVRPNNVVPNVIGSNVVNGTTRVVPMIRGVLPGLSSVLADIGTLLTSPTLTTSLRGMRAVADGLAISAHRLGALVTKLGGRIPNVVGGTGNILSGAGQLASGLTDLSIRNALSHIGTALSNTRGFARRLGDKGNDLNLLVGSAHLCRGLGSAVSRTSSLIVSLGTRPGHCIRFSIFKEGSG